MVWCPPRRANAITDPVRSNVIDVYKPVIVPHIHHMHTEVRTHMMYQHQHFFPQTVSHCFDECHQHTMMNQPQMIDPSQFCC